MRSTITATERFDAYRDLIARRQNHHTLASDEVIQRYTDAVQLANNDHHGCDCGENPCDAWCAAWATELDASYTALGVDAYTQGLGPAPALNPIVMAAVGDLRVGTGAAEIMAAFSKGWHDAAQEAADAALADA